jgi:hypothetical protein
MLPVSQAEKVTFAIIQTGILIPALLVIVFWGFIFIIHRISSAEIAMDLSVFFKNIVFDAIQAQSLIFLGVFWFKDKKILKVILAITALIIALVAWEHLFENYYSNETVLKFVENFEWLFEFLSNHGRVIFAILMPLGPWLIAYKKFTKTQV